MISNEVLEIDDLSLKRFFSRLEEGLRGDIILKAMRSGAEVIQKSTKAELRKDMASLRASHKISKPVHRKKPMESGVSLVEDKAMAEVRVSLLGDFRLKWFELGTKERKLRYTGAKDRERGRVKGDKRHLYRKRGKENFYRAGTNRGKIEAMNFFATARRDEGAVISAINKELESELQKLMR